MHIDKRMPLKANVTLDDKTTPEPTIVEIATKPTTVVGDSSTNPSASVAPVEGATTSKGMPLAVFSEVTTKAAVTSPTKMEIATAVFKRMRKSKGTTRKEIIDQFVEEAKLSKAGAATYYQLIKAKVR